MNRIADSNGTVKRQRPTRAPGTRHADPADVMVISGYWSNLPHYRLDDVFVQESDGQTYCDVSYASTDPLSPPEMPRTFHVKTTDNGLRLTEVEWQEASQRWEDVYSLRIVREAQQSEQRVLDEHERRMDPLVIREVRIPVKVAR